MITKLIVVITLLMSLNLISKMTMGRWFTLVWKNSSIIWLWLSIFSIIYQTYYWLTKFNII